MSQRLTRKSKKKGPLSKPGAVAQEESKEQEEVKKEVPVRRRRHADRGVVYLSHLPYGFFEEEMKGFFKQFGEVTRLRLSRNPKTERSNHYAFVEFEDQEVAKIVAETMDKYMMYGHTLVSRFVEPAEVKPSMFRQSHRTPRAKLQAVSREEHNKVLTADEQALRLERLVKKDQKRREQLEQLGINYQFPGFEAQIPKKPKRVKVVNED